MLLRRRDAALVAAIWLTLVTSCGGDDSGGPSNPAGIGNRCVRAEDCPTGECYLGPGGGYCTSPCTTEGDISECPLDTVCKPIQGGARRCLLVCGSSSSCGDARCPDGFCPSGSSCVSVSHTGLKACEPEPK